MKQLSYFKRKQLKKLEREVSACQLILGQKSIFSLICPSDTRKVAQNNNIPASSTNQLMLSFSKAPR